VQMEPQDLLELMEAMALQDHKERLEQLALRET
jgi:hypothetical protein